MPFAKLDDSPMFRKQVMDDIRTKSLCFFSIFLLVLAALLAQSLVFFVLSLDLEL